MGNNNFFSNLTASVVYHIDYTINMLEQLMVQQLSYPVQLRATRLNLTWAISASISDLKKGLYARKVTDFFPPVSEV